MTIEDRLRCLIRTLLGDPAGDPDRHHMLGAAHAILLMEQLGITYGDDDIFDRLSNKKGYENVHQIDFIDAARKDGHVRVCHRNVDGS